MMMRNRTMYSVTICVVATIVFMLTAVVVPTHAHADGMVIAAEQTFPKRTHVRRQILAEAVSTTVESNSHWGGIEQLNIPVTKSDAQRQAEKRAREARLRAERLRAQQVSRSAQRRPLRVATRKPVVVQAPNNKSVASLLTFANQFVGRVPYVWGGNSPRGWDCSGFVQYVYASLGYRLPRVSSAQARVGVRIPSLAQARPGDIIANGMHAAIYVGNGMVINAENLGKGTCYDPVSVAFSSAYTIRRVL